MSESKPAPEPAEPKAFGWMAEYDDEHKLLDAARKVRDSGYTRTDAFTPFPVHGIDEALGIKPTVLPWFTFAAGACGTMTALLMQWYMNAIDYPYIISGKPYASWPAFIPVTFELTVLFAAFTTVLAMLALNGLPKFSNPVFTNPKFDRASDDRFFLWVDSRDKYFNSDKVKNLLAETGAVGVDEVREDDSPSTIPKKLILTILALIGFTLIPGAIVLNMRNAKSSESRWQVFFDMDYQPNLKPQRRTSLFADRRVERPPVPGTVARGDLNLSDPYYLGYDPDQLAALQQDSNTRLVSLQEGEVDAAAMDEAQAAAADNLDNYPWVTDLPEGFANDEMFTLGKQKFEQNCAVCHGYAGYGDGLVSQRANNLAQGYWLTPTSLHDERVRAQPVGRIYHTIANGKGKMGGYAASLNPDERWAVVLYVRAMQRSQNANPADIPEGVQVTELEPLQVSTAAATATDDATEEPAQPASGDDKASAEESAPAESAAGESTSVAPTPAEPPASESASSEEPPAGQAATEEPPKSAEEPAKTDSSETPTEEAAAAQGTASTGAQTDQVPDVKQPAAGQPPKPVGGKENS